MSSHRLDPPVGTSLIEVALDIEDRRKGIDDYRIAQSLLKSIILPADVRNFKEAWGTFRIQDSYDSILRMSIDHFPSFTHLWLIF